MAIRNPSNVSSGKSSRKRSAVAHPATGEKTVIKPDSGFAEPRRPIADAAAALSKAQSHLVKTAKFPIGEIVIAQRAGAVVAALGSKAQLASMLEVSPSQPTRWIDGSERPNSENARAIVDLDYVIARAGLLWKPSVIGSWLNGSNAFLDGARPIDVLRATGSAPVIDALDQELAGGYA